MKFQPLATALLVSALLGMSAQADECTATCEQEYTDCKASAETDTAKKACDEDVKQCKADCK